VDARTGRLTDNKDSSGYSRAQHWPRAEWQMCLACSASTHGCQERIERRVIRVEQRSRDLTGLLPLFLSLPSISQANIIRLSDAGNAITLPCRRRITRFDSTEQDNMSRHRLFAFLAVPAFFLSGLALPDTISAATPATDRASIPETQMALRDLWVEHIFWIRSYVLATHASDAAQSKDAEAEVIANAKALAGTIAPFYGQAASDSLLELLAGHWGAVRDYNTETLAKSKAGQDKAVANLSSNAREIAKFLSGANPNLPEDAVFNLLLGHGGHHVAQIKQIASNDFRNEAATWHAMRKHMLVISDAIADALVKQFPERFGDRA
jgi:hypothetical protein